MAIKHRDLRKAFTTTPPLAELTGGKLARADRVRSVHAQLDSLLGNGRPVVARVGLQGNAAFQAVSTAPVIGSQTRPLRTVYRTVARVPAFAVMPGHFLRVSALVSPSGQTDRFAGGVGWVADAAYGEIAVVVTWAGPAADTTTHKLILAPSTETNGGEDTAAGASWANLRRVEIPLAFPGTVTTSATSLRLWSEGVTAAIEVKFKGGVRCVDLVIQQVPFAYARTVGTDTTYSSTLITNGVGELTPSYPVAYPVEKLSTSDPTYGSIHAANVSDRQQHALGPILAQWGSWNESAAVTATDLPMVTTTSTTFVDMLRTSVTTWAATNPGLSVSAGGMAQQFKSSNSHRVLRGRNACIPVRVWAYCSRVGATAATLRFQTADYSVCEVTVNSGTAAWVSATGHLRCGVHPEDFSVLQVLGKAPSGGTSLSVSSVLVEYADL